MSKPARRPKAMDRRAEIPATRFTGRVGLSYRAKRGISLCLRPDRRTKKQGKIPRFARNARFHACLCGVKGGSFAAALQGASRIFKHSGGRRLFGIFPQDESRHLCGDGAFAVWAISPRSKRQNRSAKQLSWRAMICTERARRAAYPASSD